MNKRFECISYCRGSRQLSNFREIDTHPSYRKKGLARVIASQLILECLQNDCYPSWDAHNQASLNLAMQLGYEYDGPYQVYLLKRL